MGERKPAINAEGTSGERIIRTERGLFLAKKKKFVFISRNPHIFISNIDLVTVIYLKKK